MESITQKIFNIQSEADLRQMALLVFRLQASRNPVYAQYVKFLGIDTETVKEISQIPFLPVEFFKTHKIYTETESNDQEPTIFTSSGEIKSKHYVSDISIYEKSYLECFTRFYGSIEEYCILALLPSYLEREGSSLIYMTDDLIKKSKHPDSGSYLNNSEEFISKIKVLESKKQKTILLGVTYALLDLLEKQTFELKYTIVMETGGMKGKRKEMIREELHEILCKGYGVVSIHSEYGMTELLSQAYSKGNGIFYSPPWMKVMIRDTNDPLVYLKPHKSGGINVMDLANLYSCSFIATQDLGKIYPDNSFEVLGRFDNSDVRGCNLLVQ